MFLLLGGCVTWRAVTDRGVVDGSGGRAWTSVGVALVILGLLRLAMIDGHYERGSTSSRILMAHWKVSVAGAPALCAALTLTCGALLIAARRRASSVLRWGAVIAACGAALVLIPRLAAFEGWSSALLWRSWILLFNVPLVFLAIADGRLLELARRVHSPPGMHRDDRPLVMCCAALFSLVATVQALAWNRLTTKFMDELSATRFACIERPELPWTGSTALSQWPTASLSIALQERRVEKIMLERGGCDAARVRGVLPLHPLERPLAADGWFDFRIVLAR
jgi:hypothetical protein